MGEAARFLFRPGGESLLELSELSLIGVPGVKRRNRLINTPNREDVDE